MVVVASPWGSQGPGRTPHGPGLQSQLQGSSEGRELTQLTTPHGQCVAIQQETPTQTCLYHTGGWSDTQQTHLSHRGENTSPAPVWVVDETPGVQGPMGARTRPPKVWT